MALSMGHGGAAQIEPEITSPVAAQPVGPV
jgi:hypothetical protein